jgi:uncharacterized membrane protein YvlD (DUF360 family)
VKFWLRWFANGIALFLALYLVDSLLHERFHFSKTWPAVVAAIILGFIDSFVRPLHRAKSNAPRAALTMVAVVLVNTLILQLFVWVGAQVTARSLLWILAAGAFTTLISGLINWQVGFGQTKKPRASVSEKRKTGAGSTERQRAPRAS